MSRSSGSESTVNDDWIERGAWTGWGEPADVVAHDPGAEAKLRAVAGRPAGAGYRVPVMVGLIPDPDGGIVRVEVAGYAVGRLETPAGVAAPRSPGAVCGLVEANQRGEPRLRLWPDRRMSAGHAVTITHQREAIT